MKNKKVLMLVYSHFPGDTRVRREADALMKAGYIVDVLCVLDEEQDAREVFENVNVYRMKLMKSRGSFLIYFYKYLLFFLMSLVKVNTLFIKNRYDYIHVHNMPNFIVFTAILPKIFGKKIILDQHDPSPEIFISLTKKDTKSLLFKLALLEEKLSTWFANQVITTNIAFRDLFVSRSCPTNKIEIVMNSPQTSVFNNVNTSSNENVGSPARFRLMYNGTIIKRHGLDVLIDSVDILKNKIPDIELNIYGEGEFLQEILEKIKALNLNKYVIYRGAFILDKIAAAIPMMDLGVIPNRFNVFTNINFPIRIFEFIYFKKPVIVPKTRGISDYFSDDSILYFRPGDADDLASVILSVYNKSVDLEQIIRKGYKIFQENTWEIQYKKLLEVYRKLGN